VFVAVVIDLQKFAILPVFIEIEVEAEVFRDFPIPRSNTVKMALYNDGLYPLVGGARIPRQLFAASKI
jgi:hypothetical protein